MSFLGRTVTNGLALWITTIILPGIRLVGPEDGPLAGLGPVGRMVVYFLLAGAVLALVNTFVRPFVMLISLPFYVVTLGLFFMVVNALMLMLTAWITGYFELSLVVDGFGWALAGGVVVGVVNWISALVTASK